MFLAKILKENKKHKQKYWINKLTDQKIDNVDVNKIQLRCILASAETKVFVL